MAQKIRQVITITYEPIDTNYDVYEEELPSIYEKAAHDKMLLNSNELLIGDFDPENVKIEWSIVDG